MLKSEFPFKISYDQFSFTTDLRGEDVVAHKLSFPRLGCLKTPHGIVETPNFIFCGTRATVKAVPTHHLRKLKTQFVLSNTYHLMLQPGADLIERMGGLHTFMGFDGPILTDSGGYQIFAMGYGSVGNEIKRRSSSKKSLVKLNEEGCWFKSYLDGSKVFLSPEKSISIQKKLRADFIVQLDECTPYHISYEATKKSMELSMRWGDRSLSEFYHLFNGQQAIYGVIQGGVYADLRKVSSEYVLDRPFFGIAIGGSLGKSKEEMYGVISQTMELVRSTVAYGKRPVHLLGIGGIEDIFFGVRQGIDTFDCVIPTRLARHGSAIVPAHYHTSKNQNKINLKNQIFRDDPTPLIISSRGIEDHQIYSKAYIHHLFKSKEILAVQLLTEHNILQMNLLMEDIRKGLATNTLDEVEKFWCG